MRTSLNKIQTIEDFLTGSMEAEDRLVFEATILVDKSLADEVSLQRATYCHIRSYGREQLRNELDTIHHKLMNNQSDRTFRDLIFSIFQKP
ncbi:MAG TPA: hypothetical protein VGD65_04680 [Chryseosolibacter sp.]